MKKTNKQKNEIRTKPEKQIRFESEAERETDLSLSKKYYTLLSHIRCYRSFAGEEESETLERKQK
ncbi:hypothetical protein AALP_AA7G139200 [Arabis alpina]|uniref:Uncharacterized protein n=1 Tax=Arabis alpina TaxID=50452 RepID=A0A087GHX5_ARAAL|nr:hypothetical protein AALP_AA7G139200 [Arabis alpina]